MEVLFNELSLIGQFSDQDAFVKNGLLPFLRVLKELHGFSTLLLKKSDVWQERVTPTNTLYSLLTSTKFRECDEFIRLKSAIIDLTKEPFWDSDSRQFADSRYFFNGSDVHGSSLAEACERDKVVISFVDSSSSGDPLNVLRNEINIPLKNLTCLGTLTELLWAEKRILFEAYMTARFSGGKLDFSRIDAKMGFSTVQPAEQDLFVDTFRKFEALTWKQIHTDQGLGYKEYHGIIDTSYRNIKTYKFRASRKFRCHGYRENDVFIVIGFETDHKLSDRG
ncbi:MAG: hypothetical protein D3923_07245 [Candidatus Electrothrix sp. AR3]|nr:hypothetical protein [Candidatus Electrothrix sp. AR3]